MAETESEAVFSLLRLIQLLLVTCLNFIILLCALTENDKLRGNDAAA